MNESLTMVSIHVGFDCVNFIVILKFKVEIIVGIHVDCDDIVFLILWLYRLYQARANIDYTRPGQT